jgi:hypothetical protein
MRSVERVRWVGSVSPRTVVDQLPLANPVNSHDYKPAFVRRGGELVCHVAGPDGRDQVIRAWRLLDYGTLETIDDFSDDALGLAEKSLANAIAALPHHPRVVIVARLDSFMYARMLALRLEKGLVSGFAARKEFIARESSRLENEFRAELPVSEVVEGVRTYVRTAWLPEEDMMVVNLPWGPRLSEVTAKVVGTLDSEVVVVGGVGAVSPEIDVETVFLADSVRRPDDDVVVPIRNVLIDEAAKLDLEFSGGCIGSVASALYGEGRNSVQGIDVVETEVAYMSSLWMSGREFGVAHYVMDNAGRGLPLSKTYYSKEWLEVLAKKSRRAKNLCYSTVLSRYGVGAEALMRL